MTEPDEYWMAWGPDDPDMWRASCDDEWLSYPLESDIDGAGDRVDYAYR